MKDREKRVNYSVLYIFLILFFGWILTQFIAINKDSLLIKDNQITGLALQIDPLSGLGNLLSNEVRLGAGGESFPVWIYLVTFAIAMSVIFIAARNIAFFKGDERRGAAIMFSIGVTALTVFSTNIVSWIAYLAASLGFFLILIIIALLGLDGYFAVHKTVSEGVGGLTEVASQRQTARNTLITARNQQPVPTPNQPTALGRIFNRIRHPLTNPPQTQAQAQQVRQQRGQTQRQAQQNLRQQQQIRQRWLLFLQQSQQNLNLLVNQLDNQRNWNNVLGELARISQIRRDLPNIRTGNIGTLLRTGQTHMQRVLANPNDARNIALAIQFLNNVQTTYNLILNQL